MSHYLRIYPDPVLRKKAANIDDFSENLTVLVSDMRRILAEVGGVGLAAPQIGVSKRVILVRMNPMGRVEDEDVRVFINPEIMDATGSRIGEEGCLSIPDVLGEVERSAQVKIRAKDLLGKHLDFTAQDLVSVIFQHEIDHLDGILFTDRMNAAKKITISSQLKQLKKKYQKDGKS